MNTFDSSSIKVNPSKDVVCSLRTSFRGKPEKLMGFPSFFFFFFFFFRFVSAVHDIFALILEGVKDSNSHFIVIC